MLIRKLTIVSIGWMKSRKYDECALVNNWIRNKKRNTPKSLKRTELSLYDYELWILKIRQRLL
jgi:hypothetical protein